MWVLRTRVKKKIDNQVPGFIQKNETNTHKLVRNTELVYRYDYIHMTLTLHLIIEMHLYLLHECMHSLANISLWKKRRNRIRTVMRRYYRSNGHLNLAVSVSMCVNVLKCMCLSALATLLRLYCTRTRVYWYFSYFLDSSSIIFIAHFNFSFNFFFLFALLALFFFLHTLMKRNRIWNTFKWMNVSNRQIGNNIRI